MRLRFHPLFRLRCRVGFFNDTEVYDGIEVIASSGCESRMNQFAIRSRKVPSGVELYYQTQPKDLSLVPLRPIENEEIFRFFLRVRDSSFATLADVRGWHADKIFVLENPVYNTTGEVAVLNGPLQAPISFRPLKWKYAVTLRATPSLLAVKDEGGTTIITIPVRPLEENEVPGARDEYAIDLSKGGEGTYTVEHVYAGAPPGEKFFCSPDYQPGILAVAAIRYRYGAGWTGLLPSLTFMVRIQPRASEWFYKVFISPANRSLYPANELQLVHRPGQGEPPLNFQVDGLPNNEQGFVTFKSVTPIPFPGKPMHFDLVRQPASVVMPRLPMPHAGQVILKEGQLASSVIINI